MQSPNSRYMLAEQMTPIVASYPYLIASTPSQIPVAEFARVFTPVANLTTLNVNIRTAVQADIALMFNYTSNHWSLDLGYDFWFVVAKK